MNGASRHWLYCLGVPNLLGSNSRVQFVCSAQCNNFYIYWRWHRNIFQLNPASDGWYERLKLLCRKLNVREEDSEACHHLSGLRINRWCWKSIFKVCELDHHLHHHHHHHHHQGHLEYLLHRAQCKMLSCWQPPLNLSAFRTVFYLGEFCLILVLVCFLLLLLNN